MYIYIHYYRYFVMTFVQMMWFIICFVYSYTMCNIIYIYIYAFWLAIHCIGLTLSYSSRHNLGKRVIFTRLRGGGRPHRDRKFVRLVFPRSRAAGCTKTMSFTTCLHLYNQKSTGIHHVFSCVKRNTWPKRRYLQGFLDVLEHTDICSVLSNKLSKHIT